MTPKQANYLLITITFCLAFLAWGTIVVMRQVTDVNYHTPTKMDAYKACMADTGYSPVSSDCKALAGVK